MYCYITTSLQETHTHTHLQKEKTENSVLWAAPVWAAEVEPCPGGGGSCSGVDSSKLSLWSAQTQACHRSCQLVLIWRRSGAVDSSTLPSPPIPPCPFPPVLPSPRPAMGWALASPLTPTEGRYSYNTGGGSCLSKVTPWPNLACLSQAEHGWVSDWKASILIKRATVTQQKQNMTHSDVIFHGCWYYC